MEHCTLDTLAPYYFNYSAQLNIKLRNYSGILTSRLNFKKVHSNNL